MLICHLDHSQCTHESYTVLLFSLVLDCLLSDRHKGKPFSPVTVPVTLIICDSSIPQFPRILSTFCPVYYAPWTTRTSDACLWPYSHIMDSAPCSHVWKQPNIGDPTTVETKKISDHCFVCPYRLLFRISMLNKGQEKWLCAEIIHHQTDLVCRTAGACEG